jgi:hypothetical protein
MLSGRNEPQLSAPVPTRSGRCYSRMAVPRPTRTQRLDTGNQTLKHGCRNSERSQDYSSHMCQALGLATRIYRGDTSRNFYALPAVVQKQDAIGWQSLPGRPALSGWSEVQHRYYEFLDGRRTGLLVDCSYPEIMGCSMGHVGSPQPGCYDQEHSVAHDFR